MSLRSSNGLDVKYGGEDRIRTCGRLPHTRFPGVPIKPLWHLSTYVLLNWLDQFDYFVSACRVVGHQVANRRTSQLYGGEGGIRTPDAAERHTGFRDRRFQPLSHLSGRVQARTGSTRGRPAIIATRLLAEPSSVYGITRTDRRAESLTLRIGRKYDYQAALVKAYRISTNLIVGFEPLSAQQDWSRRRLFMFQGFSVTGVAQLETGRSR